LQKLETNTQHEQGFKMDVGTNLQPLKKQEFQIEIVRGTKNKPFANPSSIMNHDHNMGIPNSITHCNSQAPTWESNSITIGSKFL
jgi:hypothetical protein